MKACLLSLIASHSPRVVTGFLAMRATMPLVVDRQTSRMSGPVSVGHPPQLDLGCNVPRPRHEAPRSTPTDRNTTIEASGYVRLQGAGKQKGNRCVWRVG